MDQKEEFILLWKSRKYTVTVLAKMFGISRPTAYKFINRYKTHGLNGLMELSRAPHKVHNKTNERIENEILKLRNRHPNWGAPKLEVLLEDKFPDTHLPGTSTISAILKRNGMVKERKRQHRMEPVFPIFDPLASNEVWSADFKGKFRMGNREYCYPLTIADSYSRYIFAAKGMRRTQNREIHYAKWGYSSQRHYQANMSVWKSWGMEFIVYTFVNSFWVM